uniref:IMD domain-containing protein n=1 Tax=Terrapene triunguis TaxID=2587831 RepID=A0A674K0J6_9SAUR
MGSCIPSPHAPPQRGRVPAWGEGYTLRPTPEGLRPSARRGVILDQFNPGLRSFVTMGKSYQRALSGVTVAAKGYFDALVKLGELASDSQGSKELGDTLFQMAEVHRQIQVQLEETVSISPPPRPLP